MNPDYIRRAHERRKASKRTKRDIWLACTLGTKNPRSRFTEKQVLSIRRKHKEGTSIAALARSHGASHSGIQSIVNRKNWKHLP